MFVWEPFIRMVQFDITVSALLPEAQHELAIQGNEFYSGFYEYSGAWTPLSTANVDWSWSSTVSHLNLGVVTRIRGNSRSLAPMLHKRMVWEDSGMCTFLAAD
jgi:hypothetical protein